MSDLPRLILDTNAPLSGLAHRGSASGRVLGLCENRRALLLMSRPIQAEYRRVLGSAEMLQRNPQITQESVELVLRRLRYIGQYVGQVSARFRFDRDPEDEPFIELVPSTARRHIW